MKRINQKLTALSAMALVLGVTTIFAPQKANAQMIELATSAVNAIFNRPPKPIPNHNFSLGTNNVNGNTFNFCWFPCLPVSSSTQARFLASTASRTIVPSQRSFARTTVQTQTRNFRPGLPIQPQVIPQRTAPRPTLIVPPLKLPINLPL